MQFIDLKAQQNQKLQGGLTLKEDIEKNIKKVIDHGQYILGPEVKQLENELAKYVGVKNCITVSSGTDALLASLMALDIRYGENYNYSILFLRYCRNYFISWSKTCIYRYKKIFIQFRLREIRNGNIFTNYQLVFMLFTAISMTHVYHN